MPNQPIKPCLISLKTFSHGKLLKRILISILMINILISGYILWCLYKSKASPIVYHGIDLYVQEQYLDYEKGQSLKNYLESAEYLNSGTVIDFRYYDYKRRDLPWKKHADLYWIDYHFPSDYDTLYKSIKERAKLYDVAGNGESYLVNSQNSSGVLISFYEDSKSVRLLYIPQLGNRQINSLINYTIYLDWIEDEGQGDEGQGDRSVVSTPSSDDPQK